MSSCHALHTCLPFLNKCVHCSLPPVTSKALIDELKDLLETIRRGSECDARAAARSAHGRLIRLHKQKVQGLAVIAFSKRPQPNVRTAAVYAMSH